MRDGGMMSNLCRASGWAGPARRGYGLGEFIFLPAELLYGPCLPDTLFTGGRAPGWGLVPPHCLTPTSSWNPGLPFF
ncbi:hypothetical protein AAFF_G00054270 [Aldrovandia affinis]|uniref:Uncharacterized protein n=1 Tax=Aldrovandia affinis TaxID=143900 RepID=A0AAD7S1C3_9TELE|nr:hypothetical protein AAFF_G00054270 [Aldrovandia affinis]